MSTQAAIQLGRRGKSGTEGPRGGPLERHSGAWRRPRSPRSVRLRRLGVAAALLAGGIGAAKRMRC